MQLPDDTACNTACSDIYTVFIGTCNVSGESPKQSLQEWLLVDSTPPDLYVIGFQELHHNIWAYVSTDSSKQEEWVHAIEAELNSSGNYAMIKLERLVGIMLIVFAKDYLLEHVRNVASSKVGTGIMRKLGNKGAVAIRFDIQRTSLCFVNCHLDADVDSCEKRNEDYREICSRIAFNVFAQPIIIQSHDQVYWLGDMNYRIVGIESEEIKSLVEQKLYSVLLKHDELLIQKKNGDIFEGFDEGTITFPPTYKYDTGTDSWDSSKKHRPPAWCDRILWKGSNITQLCYRSHPTLLLSDHKPLSALFSVRIDRSYILKSEDIKNS